MYLSEQDKLMIAKLLRQQSGGNSIEQHMAGMKNPFTTPDIIEPEGQVSAQLRDLDPSNIPGMPQTPEMPADPPLITSTAGARSRLDSQQAFANALRGTKMPEGQRVGPSNIYVRNPWDAAEAGFNRAYGGYLSGKLKGKYNELDQQDADNQKALLLRKAAQTEDDRAFQIEQAEAQRAHDIEVEALKLNQQAARDARKDQQAVVSSNKSELSEIANEISGEVDYKRKRADKFLSDSRKRLEKDGAGGKKGKNSADKRVTYLGKTARSSLNGLKALVYGTSAVVPNKDTKMEYDPGSVSALWNKTATDLGGPANFLASSGGQIYAAQSESVRESLLRMATGAAAPTEEQKSYFRALIPAPGDADDVVAMKMNKMDKFIGYLEEAGGYDTEEEALENLDAIIDRLEAEDTSKMPLRENATGHLQVKEINGKRYGQLQGGEWEEL